MLNFAAATMRYVDAGCNREGLERYPIHIASERGHSGIVKLLVQRGARLHRQDDHGNTPLHIALKHGQMSTTRLPLPPPPAVIAAALARPVLTSDAPRGVRCFCRLHARLD